MIKQSLVIYNLPVLFNILNEIKENFKFDLYNFKKKDEILKLKKNELGNYLILTNSQNRIKNIVNQIILDEFPFKIDEIIEKVNISLLKLKYNDQSKVLVGDYKIDINSREISYKDMTDNSENQIVQSVETTNAIIEKVFQSEEKILPEVFAIVREAAFRTLKERHFDVQLMGGIVLHENKIAEMKTGEGKTLVSTLPVCLNALEEKGVHIVTVNDYLAKRDSEWMGKIYKFLGLKVGCITNDMDDHQREKNLL